MAPLDGATAPEGRKDEKRLRLSRVTGHTSDAWKGTSKEPSALLGPMAKASTAGHRVQGEMGPSWRETWPLAATGCHRACLHGGYPLL